jgi:hypothetical protein
VTDVRGIFLSPWCEVVDGRVDGIDIELDPQELRFAILLWDKLVYPRQQILPMAKEPEVDFLVSEQVVDRVPLTLTEADDFTTRYPEAHLALFRKLDRLEPGVWSLAQGERSISFYDTGLAKDRGLLVQLHRRIPIPDKEVPLADIMAFREKRRPELLALRSRLEDLYQQVVAAGDGPLALNTAIVNLDTAIADHLKTMKESRLRLVFSDVSVNLNLSKGVSAAVATYALTKDAIVATIAGAAVGVSVKIGVGLKWQSPSKTPFRYISRFHDELF